MADQYANHGSGLDSPGIGHYAITPHASNDEAIAFRAVWVGAAGNVEVVALNGAAVLYKGCAAGSVIPMRGKRVNAVNTTATDLVGMY